MCAVKLKSGKGGKEKRIRSCGVGKKRRCFHVFEAGGGGGKEATDDYLPLPSINEKEMGLLFVGEKKGMAAPNQARREGKKLPLFHCRGKGK